MGDISTDRDVRSRSCAPDPLNMIPRILTKLYSLWVSATFPFAACGRHLSIHHSVELHREAAPAIELGDDVIIAKDAWLNVEKNASQPGDPTIEIDDDCVIARRVQISARNSIHLEHDVILSASVVIMDHNHAYEDVTRPIREQGITSGGRIRIEAGCWIGHGAAVICDHGELVIGHNSVIAANAVVSRSCPPYSVVSGNPARVVKQFDAIKKMWVLGSSRAAGFEPARAGDRLRSAAEQESVQQ